MIKRINDLLAGWKMTAVGGVFLIASFVLPRMGYPWGEKLAWVSIIICGLPLLYLALWRVVYNKGISKISSALLITMAMIAAICIGDRFAAGEVAFIMGLGALLEDMTTERAKKGLKKLISLAPKTGRVISGGEERDVRVEEIKPGDILRVLPGETFAADGVVVSGKTTADQSVMTGESLPVDKEPGDSVFSGTINLFGSVDVNVTKTPEDSSLERIIRMAKEAEEKQAPTQRIADKWASILVPAALIIAVLAYVFTGDIVRAVAVMVVFCPCALVLATPTAIVAAIGQAAKNGVIIRSGEALENMGKVQTMAFDKTGTLTYGKPAVSDIVTLRSLDESELLAIAASAESRSEHPLGRAIVEAAAERELSVPESTGFEMTAGGGVSALVNGKKYYIGNERYMAERGIDIASLSDELDRKRSQGKACVIASCDDEPIGIIALSDAVRPEALEAIKKLESMGTSCVIITGDNGRTANIIAEEVGITKVHAELLPEDKVRCIEELKKTGKVCMAGDGVNDAPALKTADVGVAMGAMGSDIAVEAADAALMTDDILKLPYLKWLSNETVKTIKGAITLSMCINFVAVTLSVLGVLTPTVGALVHNAGSCFVVLLAALLYDRKYK